MPIIDFFGLGSWFLGFWALRFFVCFCSSVFACTQYAKVFFVGTEN
jgi:hypothetical protein